MSKFKNHILKKLEYYKKYRPMPIYQNTKTKLSAIKEKSFKLEKEIQTLFEENLKNIMGLQLIKSEFAIKNKRIDTLGYDKESKAFIIIEY